METIYLNKENLAAYQEIASANVMALGCFDGLHHGHVKVIQTAWQEAKKRQVSLSVMSFFPHPKTVIGGKACFHYLMPQSEKEKRLCELGVDTFYLVEFDREFSGLSPQAFVKEYLVNLGVFHAVAGYDFSYGSRGAGNMDTLKQDSGDRIEVTTVDKVEHKGEKISSTRIRQLLLDGNVQELPYLIGHSYESKCKGTGTFLTPYSHYTLPAPGRYDVTLKNESTSFQTEVMVIEKGVTLTSLDQIPSWLEGTLTIVWHRRMKAEKVQTGKKDHTFCIIDGKVMEKSLQKLNLSQTWLDDQLKQSGVSLSDVFYAKIQTDGSLHIDQKNNINLLL
ncbi:bifunctional riboflavin kinase/FMN adenylyltransferase [Bacillus sp. AFS076308]|uniref:YetF domain-containing protein n=1 Tax=unclassified Bacillus (in: firmicutes) TaxID=185979 RepID=UPI000BF6B8E4|nr:MULTISPECIES: YetF domain-containing protein [unclassified Bacillus (in: firmicutes)]PFO03330.1 bifunctional riboflavin kinase/FMN adenylyltransferase [Bacillus sp. AFS076308]PGV48580.1 bifunctional riboflavin kinase/FMN adenylyltransferase [Bacillus sp. AFS037270]